MGNKHAGKSKRPKGPKEAESTSQGEESVPEEAQQCGEGYLQQIPEIKKILDEEQYEQYKQWKLQLVEEGMSSEQYEKVVQSLRQLKAYIQRDKNLEKQILMLEHVVHKDLAAHRSRNYEVQDIAVKWELLIKMLRIMLKMFKGEADHETKSVLVKNLQEIVQIEPCLAYDVFKRYYDKCADKRNNLLSKSVPLLLKMVQLDKFELFDEYDRNKIMLTLQEWQAPRGSGPESADLDAYFHAKYGAKIEELFASVNTEGRITNNRIIKEGIFEIALRQGRDGLRQICQSYIPPNLQEEFYKQNCAKEIFDEINRAIMFEVFICIISIALEQEELLPQSSKNCRQLQYFIRNQVNAKGVVGLYVVADEFFGAEKTALKEAFLRRCQQDRLLLYDVYLLLEAVTCTQILMKILLKLNLVSTNHVEIDEMLLRELCEKMPLYANDVAEVARAVMTQQIAPKVMELYCEQFRQEFKPYEGQFRQQQERELKHVDQLKLRAEHQIQQIMSRSGIQSKQSMLASNLVIQRISDSFQVSLEQIESLEEAQKSKIMEQLLNDKDVSSYISHERLRTLQGMLQSIPANYELQAQAGALLSYLGEEQPAGELRLLSRFPFQNISEYQKFLQLCLESRHLSPNAKALEAALRRVERLNKFKQFLPSQKLELLRYNEERRGGSVLDSQQLEQQQYRAFYEGLQLKEQIQADKKSLRDIYFIAMERGIEGIKEIS